MKQKSIEIGSFLIEETLKIHLKTKPITLCRLLCETSFFSERNFRVIFQLKRIWFITINDDYTQLSKKRVFLATSIYSRVTCCHLVRILSLNCQI